MSNQQIFLGFIYLVFFRKLFVYNKENICKEKNLKKCKNLSIISRKGTI